jgi:hypothetical protein
VQCSQKLVLAESTDPDLMCDACHGSCVVEGADLVARRVRQHLEPGRRRGCDAP